MKTKLFLKSMILNKEVFVRSMILKKLAHKKIAFCLILPRKMCKFLRFTCTFKKHDFGEKIIFKKHDFKEKKFFLKHDFE